MFNALTNLSIKTKLYSGFGVILAMCVGLVVFGAVSYTHLTLPTILRV